MTRIKLAIVEDNAAMRSTLATMFSQVPAVDFIGAYRTAEDAIREIPKTNPDVALIDIHLPGISGIECVAALRERLPKLQMLMLTRFEQNDLIFRSIRAGASGYLLKNTPRGELIQAVEQVYSGGAPMTMQIARKVIEHFQQAAAPASDVDKLSPREQEVLSLLAKGYPYKQIGDALGISINTLRNHLRAIYEKLHVHSRTEAAVRYLDRK